MLLISWGRFPSPWEVAPLILFNGAPFISWWPFFFFFLFFSPFPESRYHCCWWQRYKKESGFSHGFPLAWRICSLPGSIGFLLGRNLTLLHARGRGSALASHEINSISQKAHSVHTDVGSRSGHLTGLPVGDSFSLFLLRSVVAAALRNISGNVLLCVGPVQMAQNKLTLCT